MSTKSQHIGARYRFIRKVERKTWYSMFSSTHFTVLLRRFQSKKAPIPYARQSRIFFYLYIEVSPVRVVIQRPLFVHRDLYEAIQHHSSHKLFLSRLGSATTTHVAPATARRPRAAHRVLKVRYISGFQRTLASGYWR